MSWKIAGFDLGILRRQPANLRNLCHLRKTDFDFAARAAKISSQSCKSCQKKVLGFCPWFSPAPAGTPIGFLGVFAALRDAQCFEVLTFAKRKSA